MNKNKHILKMLTPFLIVIFCVVDLPAGEAGVGHSQSSLQGLTKRGNLAAALDPTDITPRTQVKTGEAINPKSASGAEPYHYSALTARYLEDAHWETDKLKVFPRGTSIVMGIVAILFGFILNWYWALFLGALTLFTSTKQIKEKQEKILRFNSFILIAFYLWWPYSMVLPIFQIESPWYNVILYFSLIIATVFSEKIITPLHEGAHIHIAKMFGLKIESEHSSLVAIPGLHRLNTPKYLALLAAGSITEAVLGALILLFSFLYSPFGITQAIATSILGGVLANFLPVIVSEKGLFSYKLLPSDGMAIYHRIGQDLERLKLRLQKELKRIRNVSLSEKQGLLLDINYYSSA